MRPELLRSYCGETRRFDLFVDRAAGTQYYQVDHVPAFIAASPTTIPAGG